MRFTDNSKKIKFFPRLFYGLKVMDDGQEHSQNKFLTGLKRPSKV
jgi:hypothetical protein